VITEDSIAKSSSLKCLMSQAQSLVEEIAARESYKTKFSEA